MSQVLDHIVKVELDVSETISSDYSSPSIPIDIAEGGFGLIAYLDSGIGVNMKFRLEFSIDGQIFVPNTDTEVVFSDTDGTITWDILDTNMVYVRVGAVVTAGSIDLTKLFLTAQRRH